MNRNYLSTHALISTIYKVTNAFISDILLYKNVCLNSVTRGVQKLHSFIILFSEISIVRCPCLTCVYQFSNLNMKCVTLACKCSSLNHEQNLLFPQFMTESTCSQIKVLSNVISIFSTKILMVFRSSPRPPQHCYIFHIIIL